MTQHAESLWIPGQAWNDGRGLCLIQNPLHLCVRHKLFEWFAEAGMTTGQVGLRLLLGILRGRAVELLFKAFAEIAEVLEADAEGDFGDIQFAGLE